MKSIIKKSVWSFAFCLFALLFANVTLISCTNKNKTAAKSIALFIPGILNGSPTYESLAKGMREAVDEYNKSHSTQNQVTVTVFEAGGNQSEWSGKLTSLASTAKYDVIVSSNPSLPELCTPLTEQFPNQRFILFDASITGNQNIMAISYNQKEQSYLSGYIAGLMSKTHKVGLVAAQEYPVMDDILFPYYKRGAQDAKKETTVEFRVVGSWSDASKGAEITDALCAAGVDVILPICGGASQGVISSAKEHGIYLNWFDENGFSKAPGTIISSCTVKQDVAAKETILSYLNGTTPWGTTKVAGFADGYIEFIQTDPLYEKYVSESIRAQLAALVAGYQNGSVSVPDLN